MSSAPNKYEMRKFLAPEFIFGIDARKLVGRYAKNIGVKKALIVTDNGVQTAGWTSEALTLLEEAGISYSVYSNVSPNPRDYEVMQGAEIYRQEKCDSIIAIGGGSPMDAAKGIGLVVSNNKHVLEFEGVDKAPMPMPPLICIPTTGGTSADVSQFAIITNSSEKVKIAIISKSTVPDVALIDPITLMSMDSYLTACTGMDALTHAIEAFVSNASSPITDTHALQSIKLVKQFLYASVSNLNDIELRGNIMLASLHAGLAFSNASLGSVHAMAHSLGGYLDLPHGECNAILLPYVMEYNYIASPERFEAIGDALGLDMRGMNSAEKKSAIINDINSLKKLVGITKSLKENGVSFSDTNILAAKAIKDPCNATNPRRPNQSDIETIYREAL